MRFLFTIDEIWHITITCPVKGDAWRYERSMRKIEGNGGKTFPAPPVEALATHACLLCLGDNIPLIQDTYEDISMKRQSAHMKEFGHYLFESLIGETLWKIIKDTAEQEQASLIELALSWSSTEKICHVSTGR